MDPLGDAIHPLDIGHRFNRGSNLGGRRPDMNAESEQSPAREFGPTLGQDRLSDG